MKDWIKIPEDYDIEDAEPIHGSILLLGWFDWNGSWCCEVGPYSTGRRVGKTSSVSYHGQATHYMYLPLPPNVHENAKQQNKLQPTDLEIDDRDK